ncbi:MULTISPECIES: fatty acyl-AMP ligase [unclassified Okeania]|uniref:fatty acyl-AMP ligase n=1 Tax=unclassified Okeania TaxID=2634635 RepID=UPI001429BF4D|nr:MULTISPECIES: fatty acyl-AMP ligase [unclassified Okeania]NES89141.1 fatty acyl-AMP ligase [Okeania sp. SIO2B9]NET74653.1 fatty acyl-AMP ligase [Okeania sp. SIO1F9]
MNIIDKKIKTLVDLLQNRAIENPKQIAYTFLVDGETDTISFTYQQLEQHSRAIATYLQSVCPPGERALLIYQPGLEYISAFFGCLYAGIIAVPAYPPRPNRSLARIQTIIRDTEAKVALTTKSIISTLERRASETPELNSLGWLATDYIPDNFAEKWLEPNINENTLAFLQYTSGSTATPKGVMITHSNLLHNSSLIHQCFGHSVESKGVIWLPPYHDMGLIGGIIQPLYGAFPVVLMSPLMFLQSPVRWLQAISQHQGTTSGGPNFAYDLCVRKIKAEQMQDLDLSSWELAFNGAEPISAQVLERFARTFEVCGFRREAFYPCYGMAEATLIISGGDKLAPPVQTTIATNALEQNQIVLVSETEGTKTLVGCGQTLPDQQIKIVHPEKLTLCAEGEVGEIWVSGPSIAEGYWRKPEETKQTFEAFITDALTPRAFMRTGDLGFLEGNELFVTGRLKDVIIINGRNHYPQDIEWTVEQSHPMIRPGCVAGFSVEVAGEEHLVVVAEVERNFRQLLHGSQKSKVKSQKYNSTNESVGLVKLDFFSQRNGKSDTENVDNSQDLVKSIQRSVSRNHDLQIYQILLLKPGAIPKTSSGKVQRYACREGFLAGTLQIFE